MNDMPNGVSPLAKETPFLSDFRLVLASRSPRRRQLLTAAGYVFDVLPADDGVEEAEEASAARLAPKELVARLAEVKARNVVEKIAAGALPETLAPADAENWRAAPKIVVACDSVAVCRDEILGKPADRADAERMLRLLSGSEHCVHTGLALRSIPAGPAICRVETSTLVMEPLSDERLREYLDGGLWEGKAGAFGYQDGNDWLRLTAGDESNVVGLPMAALAESLLEILRARVE